MCSDAKYAPQRVHAKLVHIIYKENTITINMAWCDKTFDSCPNASVPRTHNTICERFQRSGENCSEQNNQQNH